MAKRRRNGSRRSAELKLGLGAAARELGAARCSWLGFWEMDEEGLRGLAPNPNNYDGWGGPDAVNIFTLNEVPLHWPLVLHWASGQSKGDYDPMGMEGARSLDQVRKLKTLQQMIAWKPLISLLICTVIEVNRILS